MNSVSHLTKHAVFSSQTVLWIEERGFQSVTLPDCTWPELTKIAMQHSITRVWVLPGQELQPGEKSSEYRFSPYERHGQLAIVYVRKTGHRNPDMEIIFPENTAWEETLQDCESHNLLIALRYVEQSIGVSVGMSPGRAGWAYLKKIHPEWVEELPGIDLEASHFTNSAGPDIIWQRPLLSGEKKKKYIHKFDQRASYPYAGTQTDTGVGTPVHVNHGHDMNDFLTSKGTTRQAQAIGVWECHVEYGAYNPAMPPIWKEDRQAKSTGWLTGPMIRLLRHAGHTVTIREGYVFPERHGAFKKWGNDLWGIRQHFAVPGQWKSLSGAKLAGNLTKLIMNATFGLTASGKLDEGDEMKRPDIRVQVIARHSELIWHNIEKIRGLYGVTPVLVYMDAFLYLSDEPDGRIAFPELVCREFETDGHTPKFGGYKWEGYIDITEHFIYTFEGRESAPPPFSGRLIDLLDSERYTEGNKLEVLNAKGWVN